MWPSGLLPFRVVCECGFGRVVHVSRRLGQQWLVRRVGSHRHSAERSAASSVGGVASRRRNSASRSFPPLPRLVYLMSPFASTSGTLFRSRNSCSATSTTCVTAYPFLVVNQLRRLDVFTRIRVLRGSLAGPRFGSRLVVTAEGWRGVAGAAAGS